MEFASLCLALGKKVDIVNLTHAALEQYPQMYAEKIVEKMKAQGANFVFGAHVSEIEKTGESYILRTAEGAEIATDYILVAVGRRANVDGLGLEKLGIRLSEEKFHCAASWIFLNKGLPSADDLSRAGAFAKSMMI